MPELKDIQKEILEAIPKETLHNHPLLDRIHEELELLEITEGLNGINNLLSFYNIWQKCKGKKGDKNEINSLVAYALGLTSEKPDGDFLPKRRAFARAGFPDIDTDFDDEQRDAVYKYIIDKYGRKNVGNIGTHGLLKFKSCIRRVCKALDVANAFHKGKEAYISDNEQMVSEILSVFGKSPIIKVKDEEGKQIIVADVDAAMKYCPDFKHYTDKYPEIAEHTRYIQGTFANFGIHAAGIVISDIPLSRIAPLRTAGKGLLGTQYPQDDLESLGLIKFDILAIATLTVIKRTLELIKDNYDIEIDITSLPLDDENTFMLYRSGNLGGVFQCESWPMQQTMRDIGVSSFDDVMAAISLFRPGPMESIPDYCARKKGEMSVDYFHPSIEKHVKPYLEKTYGILIYQETIMQICNSLAGFSITDGYVVIKAIGKKKQHLMDKFAKQFVEGCVKNGVPKDIASEYWSKFIVPFASYGFNKCLDGSMTVKDKLSGKIWKIDALSNMSNLPEIILDSYLDGEIIEDKLIEVFETGEKEIYEIELDNGSILRCTIDHKFICDDKKEHTVDEIIKKDLNILYF